MAYEAGQYDWSTYKPNIDITTHNEGSGGRYLGPSRVQREWAKGEASWEAWLRSELAKAPERYGEDRYNPGKSTKSWYSDQLASLASWRNQQAALANQRETAKYSNLGAQWDAKFADYNRRQDQRFSDFTSGNDQRWSDAMADWNIEKTYDIGGQQMTTGQPFQRFLQQGQDTRQSLADMNAAWEGSVAGFNKQMGGLHDSLQQQFAQQNAMNQRSSTQNAQPTTPRYQPYRGWSGYGQGFNRKGLRITNLNI